MVFSIFALLRKSRRSILCLILASFLVMALAGCQEPAIGTTAPDTTIGDTTIPDTTTGEGSFDTTIPDATTGEGSFDTTEPETTVPETVVSDTTEPDTTEPETTAPAGPNLEQTDDLMADTPYKFGMVQEALDGQVYYLTGRMEGNYLGMTTDVNAAADIYPEAAGGGFFLYVLDGSTKRYINITDRGGRVVVSLDSAPACSYLLENSTPTVYVNGEQYCFGVRSGSTYTTIGPRKTSESNYYCKFYGQSAPVDTSWLVGTWETVWREDYEDHSALNTVTFHFAFNGTGSSSDCMWISMDQSTGQPGKEWEVAGKGYESTSYTYTFDGKRLSLACTGYDYEGYYEFTAEYTVTRTEDGFIFLAYGDQTDGRTYMKTNDLTSLKDLCDGLGVDYSLPQG